MFKAYIESIEDNGYSYRVRIPIYHRIQNTPGAVPTEQLPIAPVCTSPGVTPYYQIGDVVWVELENGEIGLPVIIGLLYRQGVDNSNAELSCTSIDVDSLANLPESTSIGTVNKSLKALPQIIDQLNIRC